MKARIMKFSRDWEKLDDRLFATIRVERGDLKFVPDETVDVASPSKKFKAHVLLACQWKLKDIPMSFLEYDLEAKKGETRQSLMNKLGKLYKFSEPPKQTDSVTIYFMEKI
jgi:hypothetical protein